MSCVGNHVASVVDVKVRFFVVALAGHDETGPDGVAVCSAATDAGHMQAGVRGQSFAVDGELLLAGLAEGAREFFCVQPLDSVLPLVHLEPCFVKTLQEFGVGQEDHL